MNQHEFRLAAFVGISSSLATAFLLIGVGAVSAEDSALTLQSLNERLHKLEVRPVNRIRAPFVVVDEKNQPVVSIESRGGAHLLRMGVLGSGPALQLERTVERATLVTQLGQSDTQARVGVINGQGPRLEIYTKENSTIIGTGPNNRHGIFLRDGGGGKGEPPAKVLGEFAANINESGGILRLNDKDGKSVLSAGANPKEGGRGQLGLSAPGKGIGVLIYSSKEGHGELQVLGDGNSKPVIELSGSKRQLLLSNKSGAPAAVMRLSQGGTGSGGNFTAVDASGNNVVSAGALSGGGGALCAIHPKKGNKCFP
jgi:hypothetical protein